MSPEGAVVTVAHSFLQ